jgi:hypothetical protein
LLQKYNKNRLKKHLKTVDHWPKVRYNTYMLSKKEFGMSYVIVAKGTGLIVTDGPNKTRAYKTFGAAKATRTRLCTKAGWNESQLNIVDRATYTAPKITVKNLMSGKPVEIDADTPWCCNPASETYWSM